MNQSDPEHSGVERFTISVPKELAERIGRYWHERRLPSRSAAVQHLVETGLKAETKKPRAKGRATSTA